MTTHEVAKRCALALAAIALILAPSAASAQAAAPASVKTVVVAPGMAGSAILSPAVRAGNTLYVSGQLPAANAGDSIQAQTRSVMTSIKTLVEAGGTSMENVTKCTVFLINQADFQGMNSVYQTFFPSNPPARSTVVVAALVRAGPKLEIECIAAIPR
jgi:2-iminobutanoate/2-iminopropanoate deaminase